MRIEELRIGNYVATENSRIVRVYDIYGGGQIEDYDGMIHDIKNLYGIEPTKKWFEDFDFHHIYDVSGEVEIDKSTNTKLEVYLESNTFFITQENDELGEKVIDDVLVTDRTGYIHLIQNLYFALTGKELELKTER